MKEIEKLEKDRELAYHSSENLLMNYYGKYFGFLSGGAIALAITFLANLIRGSQSIEPICYIQTSILLLVISSIILLFGIFFGIQARDERIKIYDIRIKEKKGDIEDKDIEDWNKSTRICKTYNRIANSSFCISLVSLIIGIIMLLLYFNDNINNYNKEKMLEERDNPIVTEEEPTNNDDFGDNERFIRKDESLGEQLPPDAEQPPEKKDKPDTTNK